MVPGKAANDAAAGSGVSVSKTAGADSWVGVADASAVVAVAMIFSEIKAGEVAVDVGVFSEACCLGVNHPRLFARSSEKMTVIKAAPLMTATKSQAPMI
jgi:hypothetical protein